MTWIRHTVEIGRRNPKQGYISFYPNGYIGFPNHLHKKIGSPNWVVFVTQPEACLFGVTPAGEDEEGFGVGKRKRDPNAFAIVSRRGAIKSIFGGYPTISIQVPAWVEDNIITCDMTNYMQYFHRHAMGSFYPVRKQRDTEWPKRTQENVTDDFLEFVNRLKDTG